VLALVLAAVRQPKVGLALAIVSLVLALGSLGGGPLGALYGRATVDAVLDSEAIDPAQKERIRMMGYEEAGSCVTIGLSLGALPFLVGAAALALALVAGRKQQAAPRPG
jgi:MFS family permease